MKTGTKKKAQQRVGILVPILVQYLLNRIYYEIICCGKCTLFFLWHGFHPIWNDRNMQSEFRNILSDNRNLPQSDACFRIF